MSERVISLLEQVLAEQQKQSGLLEKIAIQNLALIEALADEGDGDGDAPASHYLNGSPIQGGC